MNILKLKQVMKKILTPATTCTHSNVDNTGQIYFQGKVVFSQEKFSMGRIFNLSWIPTLPWPVADIKIFFST